MIPQKIATRPSSKTKKLGVNRFKWGIWCVVLVVFFTGYWQSESFELSLVMAGNALVLLLCISFLWRFKRKGRRTKLEADETGTTADKGHPSND
ncbi:MAG TPA: hypothetical protein VGE40_01065 [Bacilli bacterium]